MLAERALILAPIGRDATIASAMLGEAGITADICSSLPALLAELDRGAGFVLVTEEALRTADLHALAAWVEAQPEWADLPFILLTSRGGGLERNPAAARHLDVLGNATFIERPFHPTTLVSVAHAALRGRRRQYEARARLEALAERQYQLSVALEAGELGPWTLDLRTLEFVATPACKAHYGLGPDAPFDYRALRGAIHPDDRDAQRETGHASVASREDFKIEYRCTWPDGSLHWVQVRGRPFYAADGTPLRMIGVSQDITARKADEAALRDLNVELEARVADAVAEREAATAQLHEAQKLETIGQLTGGVAHDFNNLLTPIMGSLDLLRRSVTDERGRRLIDAALQASGRAATLVQRLLAFARRQDLQPRSVNVSALLDGMRDLIARSIGPSIEVIIESEAHLPPARIDPNQFELAILNLAVNARDAMPNGGKLRIAADSVNVTWPARVAPGRYVRVGVVDSGVGMDASTLTRAIEPFFSTKGLGKGTGLGLSMVHGLAAQSGGTLDLSSKPGQGTRAEMWLPVASTAADIDAEPAREAVPAPRAATVLLVDDEDLVRLGTADLLRDLGYRVVHAASGSEALRLLRDDRFDVLVTDYLMPVMNGAELAREARVVSPGLPVLLITGYSNIAEGPGMELPRLTKPFRQTDLAQRVSDLLQPDRANVVSLGKQPKDKRSS